MKSYTLSTAVFLTAALANQQGQINWGDWDANAWNVEHDICYGRVVGKHVPGPGRCHATASWKSAFPGNGDGCCARITDPAECSKYAELCEWENVDWAAWAEAWADIWKQSNWNWADAWKLSEDTFSAWNQNGAMAALKAMNGDVGEETFADYPLLDTPGTGVLPSNHPSMIGAFALGALGSVPAAATLKTLAGAVGLNLLMIAAPVVVVALVEHFFFDHCTWNPDAIDCQAAEHWILWLAHGKKGPEPVRPDQLDTMAKEWFDWVGAGAVGDAPVAPWDLEQIRNDKAKAWIEWLAAGGPNNPNLVEPVALFRRVDADEGFALVERLLRGEQE